MPKYIVHHDGWFFEWSTIVDAPTTYGMSRSEFEEHYRKRYGTDGMQDLPARIERAIRQGTSSHDPMTAEDLVIGNRAGPAERELSFDDVIKIYCLKQELCSLK